MTHELKCGLRLSRSAHILAPVASIPSVASSSLMSTVRASFVIGPSTSLMRAEWTPHSCPGIAICQQDHTTRRRYHGPLALMYSSISTLKPTSSTSMISHGVPSCCQVTVDNEGINTPWKVFHSRASSSQGILVSSVASR